MSIANEYVPEQTWVRLTVGESVRIARKMLGMTQSELARKTGISQPSISAIERNEEALGVDRARVLARALHVHPAVLLFPDWTPDEMAVSG